MGQCGRHDPWLLAARSLRICILTGKVDSPGGMRIGNQRDSYIQWRRSQVSCLCIQVDRSSLQLSTMTCPPQKPHEYRLPTPGWVPLRLLPSRPNKSLPPALPQPKDCRHIRPEELNQLCICIVGRPATKSFCPPAPTRSEGSIKPKRVVGQLLGASILQHQTQWIGNDGLCVPGSVSSPQAFLIFLNRGTPSQLTLMLNDVG